MRKLEDKNTTIIEISGPPGGYKSTIVRLIENWAKNGEGNIGVYVEDGNDIRGRKRGAKFHIYTKQVDYWEAPKR